MHNRTERVSSHKSLHMNVHSCIMNKSPKVETHQMDEWVMNGCTQWGVSIDGILFHSIKEALRDALTWDNLGNTMLSKRSKSLKARYYRSSLYANRQIQWEKIDLWLPRAGRRACGGWLVVVLGSFGGSENFLKVICSSGSMTNYTEIHLILHFKWVNYDMWVTSQRVFKSY